MYVNEFDLAADLPLFLVEWWRHSATATTEPPSGTDATMAPEWHVALHRAFLPRQRSIVLVAQSDAGQMQAALPVYRRMTRSLARAGETISILSELYGGRVTFITTTAARDVVVALLERLGQNFPTWSCLEMTLVDGNAHTDSFLSAARGCGCHIESEALPASPYIALPASFDEYLTTLKPGFRTEMRRGERRLREIGTLTQKIFSHPNEVDEFWAAVCRVERESWKETAGTSITTNPSQERFYREYLPIGAAAGQLCAPVLYLDGRPIAHKICVLQHGVASILKMSYVDEFRRYYPSTVLLAGYLRNITGARARYLDFMGVRDDFKLRWTNLTYTRTRHLIYRPSLRGQIDRTRHLLMRRISTVRSRVRGLNATPDHA
ncbi:MAG: hypothetical protein NAOJABEB_00198 [Steroidobacteraceae bacterium]|nr:hypothetical protein [Steroidobacteraceae bacterium]